MKTTIEYDFKYDEISRLIERIEKNQATNKKELINDKTKEVIFKD